MLYHGEVLMEDYQIVSLDHHIGRWSVLAILGGLCDGRFEAVESDIGQQGRKGAALHRTRFGGKEGPVVKHPGFEPCPQLAPQEWTWSKFGEEGVMREAVEAFFDGGVQDILGFLAHGRENRCHRIVTGTPWAKPVAIGFEARLPFRCQRTFNESMAGSIGHGRHTHSTLHQYPILL